MTYINKYMDFFGKFKIFQYGKKKTSTFLENSDIYIILVVQ